MGRERKRVLLTGASRGIGKAILEEMKSVGKFEVMAPLRSEMDLADPGAVKRYMGSILPIHVVINNAGINTLKSVDDIDRATLREMFRVNLEAPLDIIRYAVPDMKRCGFGRIVNISSIWGVSSREFRTLYSITKFGLNGLTKALAKELGPHNILVNSVCPGFVNTEMTMKNLSAEDQEQIKTHIPLRRFADPAEIAKFVRFLASEENTYITGQILLIDGGFLA